MNAATGHSKAHTIAPGRERLYGGPTIQPKAIVVIPMEARPRETWTWTGANWVQASPQVAPLCFEPHGL